MALYQSSVLKNYLKQQDSAAVEEAYKNYAKYFLNPVIQENIRNSKEEQFQATFLSELFVKVLGYVLNPNPDFNLTTEFKNEKNNRKADGAILQKDVALGVIELKGTKTKDLESIRRQAFDYKANQKGCVYVITSNFEKLRFYINDATEFIEFNLFELSEPDFELLYLCLYRDNLLSNLPLKIKEDSLTVEEQITKNFYSDYSIFKRELFRDLVKRNAKPIRLARQEQLKKITTDEAYAQELQSLDKNVKLALFKKSQKLIDRFLFIFFSEDRGLLPPNSTLQILNKWKDDMDFGDERPLYNLFKQYFHYLDTGRKGTTSRAEIYAYNGGLFQPDTILDNLEIEDDLLYRHTLKLAAYDFASQVDVNILGHIFENSLNEIESVNAEIEGAEFDKQKSKRKKDGVYYTPKYITKYIVENTVGKLCEEKKTELGFQEAEYFKSRAKRPKKKLAELVQLLDDYRDWLLKLTICDPACGSGAFLNQALDFLIKEHRYIDELKAKVLGGGLVFADIENTILENNIYGVDLNEESVEIAKLSLWLRTAQPRRKLNDLSSNIKCGNSLIDDKKVAGNKAFNWELQFPRIFESGGFDVVIGNPPYGAELTKQEEFLRLNFRSFTLSGESYILFIEQSIGLVRLNGRLGFIVPDTFLNLDFSRNIRHFILGHAIVENIVLLPANVFESATVDTTNLILKIKEPSSTAYSSSVKINLVNKKSKMIEFDNLNKEFYISSEVWITEDAFLIQSDDNDIKLLGHIDEINLCVSDFAEMYSGIKAYEVGKGTPKQTKEIRDNKPFTSSSRKNDFWEPFYEGKHILSYRLEWNNNNYIKYGQWLAAPRDKEQFDGEKLLIRKIIGSRLIATYVENTGYCNTLLFILKIKDLSIISYRALLGILNSSLIAWYFRHKFQIRNDDTFPQIMIRDILKFPIAIGSLTVGIERNVKYLLSKNKVLTKLISAFQFYLFSTLPLKKLSRKLENWQDLEFGKFIKELTKAIKKNNKLLISEDKEPVPTLTKKDEFEWLEIFEENKKKAQDLQTQIDRTEKEIDQMVYELYGLTEEEIAIVENSNA